jgi:hypothetical protein
MAAWLAAGRGANKLSPAAATPVAATPLRKLRRERKRVCRRLWSHSMHMFSSLRVTRMNNCELIFAPTRRGVNLYLLAASDKAASPNF